MTNICLNSNRLDDGDGDNPKRSLTMMRLDKSITDIVDFPKPLDSFETTNCCWPNRWASASESSRWELREESVGLETVS